MLIDTGDVIVHVFRPEVREFYQLEKMWLPGARGRRALKLNARSYLRGGPPAGRPRERADRRLSDTVRPDRSHAWAWPLAHVHEVEDNKGGGMAAEAALLQRALPKVAVTVALDERGKELSSPQFAELLARWRDAGRAIWPL